MPSLDEQFLCHFLKAMLESVTSVTLIKIRIVIEDMNVLIFWANSERTNEHFSSKAFPFILLIRLVVKL